MVDNLIYSEKVSSKKTELLFIALTIIFFMLFFWRSRVGSLDFSAYLFLFFFCFFIFYSLNYRTLIIRLTEESLKLSFGVFTWTVPLDNFYDCRVDDIPMSMRMGGAGIHFMFARRRYRASFNFLEHPRVVVELRRKVGLVRDISFSTRNPDELIQLIQQAISAKKTS